LLRKNLIAERDSGKEVRIEIERRRDFGEGVVPIAGFE